MTEREQFEKWAVSRRFDTQRSHCVADKYMSMYTEFAWEAWQAARATPALTERIRELEEALANYIAQIDRDNPSATAKLVVDEKARQKARDALCATPALPQGVEQYLAECERCATIENNVLAFNMANYMRDLLQGMAIAPVEPTPESIKYEKEWSHKNHGDNSI